MSVHLSVCMSVYLSARLLVSLYLSASLSVCLHVYVLSVLIVLNDAFHFTDMVSLRCNMRTVFISSMSATVEISKKAV